MTRRLHIAAILCVLSLSICRLGQAEIIDRIVAIVGDKEITSSDVERQLRLEALFDDRPVSQGAESRQAALDRLINQTLIAQDVRLSGLPPLTEQERSQALAELRRQGFGSLAFEEGLGRYGLAVAEVEDFLAAQIQFSRYLAFRFRSGQVVTDGEIESLYRARYGSAASAPPLDAVREQLRAEALDRKATELLEQRVRQMRAETRVDLLDPIERPGGAG